MAKSKNKASKEGKVVKLKHPEDRIATPICPLSGSKVEEFSQVLARQTINTLWLKPSDEEGADKQFQAALAGVMGCKPQDELEGMLAAQMVGAHNAAMECLRRAMHPEQSFEGRSENLSQANKLSRTYATMMEALNRYRGKGQQKVTVEHVTVNAGGQAIVGNVTRPEGGGVVTKTEDQPHAKQITHAPMPKMPCPHKEGQPVPIPSNA